MTTAIGKSDFSQRPRTPTLRGMLVAALLLASPFLAGRPAAASGVMTAAAQTADAGLAACASNNGKPLYDCVANVLDRLAGDVTRVYVPETQRSLQTAASQLRAATTKAQALSAITQCRAVITGALSRIKAAGSFVAGWGDHELNAVAGVLARAAKLIQAKG